MSRRIVFRLTALVAAVMICCASTGFAQDALIGIETMRWRFLDFGDTYFADGSNPGEFWFSGTTYGYTDCDEIGVTTHIQQFTGGDWVTIHSSTYIANNQGFVNGGRNIYVPGGYIYRAISDHWVRVGSVYEWGDTESADLYMREY